MTATASLDWTTALPMSIGHLRREVPLTNSFGNVVPDDPRAVVELFGIRPGDRVLDIGGGSQPFARADVVVEANPDDASHRGGRAAVIDERFVNARAEKLPFPDRHFDFAISRQVFEHVDDPAAACRELMRVARRGFLEMPAKAYDLLAGPNPGHQWFVSVVDDTLVFERRRFVRHPFGHPGLGRVLNSDELQFVAHRELKNVTNVQFYWEGDFAFEVHDDPDGYSYANPEHGGLAHLDVAIAGLRFPGSPPAHRLADAEAAVQRLPDHALAHYVHGQWLWLVGRRRHAEVAFLRAAALAPDDAAFRDAPMLAQTSCPPLLRPAGAHPLDRRHWAMFADEGGIDLARLLAPPALRTDGGPQADPTVSRFVRIGDPSTREFVFPLPTTWWSRGHEYPWAVQFATSEHTVLDAACGISHPLKFALAQRCRATFACDLDPRILDEQAIVADIQNDFGAAIAAAFDRRVLDRIDRACCSITASPYRDGQFDRVFCISVLEHMSTADRGAALREFARILAPQGMVVLTMDHPLVDLDEFTAAVAAAGLRFVGDVHTHVPVDALWSDACRLRCFRALLTLA